MVSTVYRLNIQSSTLVIKSLQLYSLCFQQYNCRHFWPWSQVVYLGYTLTNHGLYITYTCDDYDIDEYDIQGNMVNMRSAFEVVAAHGTSSPKICYVLGKELIILDKWHNGIYFSNFSLQVRQQLALCAIKGVAYIIWHTPTSSLQLVTMFSQC